MNPAFLYCILWSGINRLVHRVKRLRQPRYLASTIGGLAYIYFFILRQPGSARNPVAAGVPSGALPIDVMQPLIETGFAVLVLVLVLLPWFAVSPGRGLAFTEAEVQFLFPAPLTRRAVLNFRILRMQMPILFGVLVFGLLFRRGLPVPHYSSLLVSIWLLYTFLSLYRMGASLAKLSLLQRGIGPGRRITIAAVSVLATAFLVFWWLGNASTAGLTPGEWSPSGIAAWVRAVSGSGPLWLLLMPFRALTGVAYAPDLQGLLRQLPGAIGVLLVTYAWVARSQVRFEELAMEQSKEASAAAAGGSRRALLKPGRAIGDPFRLSSSGPPFLAILWKNLIGAGGVGGRRWIFVVSLLVACFLVSAGKGTNALLGAVGAGSLGVAAMLSLMGPTVFRDDLRVDLLHADQLKSWPLPGWAIVLGEILAPALLLAGIQWVLLAVGVIVFPASAKPGFDTAHRVAYGIGAAVLMPVLSLAGVLAQNVFALLMPGWVQLGKTEKRGIEASGQRIISMGATLLILLVGLLPAAAVFAGIYFVGSIVVGYVAVPVAALGAAVVLALECAAGVLLAGRLFDRLDISLETLTES